MCINLPLQISGFAGEMWQGIFALTPCEELSYLGTPGGGRQTYQMDRPDCNFFISPPSSSDLKWNSLATAMCHLQSQRPAFVSWRTYISGTIGNMGHKDCMACFILLEVRLLEVAHLKRGWKELLHFDIVPNDLASATSMTPLEERSVGKSGKASFLIRRFSGDLKECGGGF